MENKFLFFLDKTKYDRQHRVDSFLQVTLSVFFIYLFFCLSLSVNLDTEHTTTTKKKKEKLPAIAFALINKIMNRINCKLLEADF